MIENCPLCKYHDIRHFIRDARRDYFQCARCALVFVPPPQHLPEETEKAQYDLHENSPDDPSYRAFLSRLMLPMLERIGQDSKGLDFGCGPGPTLSLMFEEHGHKVRLYDKYYADDVDALSEQYDFISCTEVVEHLKRPGETFAILLDALKAGGYLGLMTKFVIDKVAFSTWHYKNDPTHICFYSHETIRHYFQKRECKVDFVGADVVIIRKG